MLGLAGGIYGLASLGVETFVLEDSGSDLYSITTIDELAEVLLSCQAENGGFSMYADYVDDAYTGVQATAYAILALSALDAEAYADEISAAASWLESVQLSTGGWTGAGSENNELTGEALWALSVVPVPTPSALLLGCLGLSAVGRLRRRRS